MAKRALEGIKVLDFTWAVAGPFATMFLAWLGATVIKVESTRRLDPNRTTGPYKDKRPGINRCGLFAQNNPNKYGVTLNLKHPKGLEIAKKLVSWADIVVENFETGTMARLGLSYENIKEINPDIIMLSAPIEGATGPRAVHPAFGGQMVGLCGFTNLVGWPDRTPVRPFGAYTDIVGIRLGVAALIASLIYRLKTGKGQWFDLSQYEATLHFLAAVIMDYLTNGQIANRMGNRHPCSAPHGAYPCKGEDKWCVIAVSSDEEWQSLCKVMGNPSWTKDPKFSTFLDRKRNEEQLDELIGKWTRNFDAHEVMVKLEGAGVAAGPVQDLEEVYSDPQLAYRRHFQPLKHPELGEYSWHLPSFRLSKTPAEITMPSCCQGEHNEYVYTKILGLSDDEFVSLLSEGVFD